MTSKDELDDAIDIPTKEPMVTESKELIFNKIKDPNFAIKYASIMEWA